MDRDNERNDKIEEQTKQEMKSDEAQTAADTAPGNEGAPQVSQTVNAAKPAVKKKSKALPITLGSIGGLVVLLLIIYCIGFFLYPFSSETNRSDIYIIKGEPAKTVIEFANKRGSDKVLTLNCGDLGLFSATIPGGETKGVEMEFPTITDDATIVAKYGFLGMKKIEIHVTAVEESQIGLGDVKIFLEDDTDITEKQYCPPKKVVFFRVDAYNDSGKDFKRNFKFKINGKTIDQQAAKWTGDQQQRTQLEFSYTFKKQKYYKIQVGDKKINFICSTNDKPPSNGKYLLRKVTGGSGQIEIKNKYKDPVIVTVCKSTAPGKPLNRMYIKGKNSATMYGIKDGSYVVYIKNGKGYSKMAKDILQTYAAYQFKDKMKFKTTSSTYTIWTLTLGVKGKGDNTKPIDGNAIPL